jgi:XTP/dITP diphosphohydrolase
VVKLLLATKNSGKIRELKALLADLDLVLLSPADLGLDLEVKEEGDTYAQNAAKKALAFAQASDLLALADDSGLEVDVLDGEPGVLSARYAPWQGASDADRRAYLLDKLRDYPRPWTARFRCVVVIAKPGGETRQFQGVCTGEIIPEERGAGGFGYDPIFLLHSLGKTMAELTMGEKNKISHRARAINAARPVLPRMLADSI